ncbi:MAG TPA: FUSC family protein [Xanthobacteraceae bacterium]|nr:FUSC family protein [Xanthobacteraceae bacterium]
MNDVINWKRARAWLGAHRPELRFCLRSTVAGLLAFAISQVFAIPLHGLWVVLTAVVVTQISVGGSLRATIDYVVGTVSGAVYAAVIGVLVPHATPIAQGGVLALTIAPLALAAAFNPSFRVAPFSAVLVLLISGQLAEGPIESALYRTLEVALGGAVAVAVSLLVFPQRAHGLGLDAAARILDQLARALPQLLAGVTGKLDPEEIRRIQNDIGEAVVAFQAIAAEAKRERVINLVAEPDPGPLSRTLLRLRHDLVIVGRAAAVPLPDSFAQRLGPLLARLGADSSDFLRKTATALPRRSRPPPLAAVEAAVNAYASEITSLRREGLTRALANDEAEQLFTLGFAVDQLHQNFSDLERCAREYAQEPVSVPADKRQ